MRKEFEYERPADLSSLASSKTPTLGEGVKSFGGGVGKSMTWFNYSFFHSLMVCFFFCFLFFLREFE